MIHLFYLYDDIYLIGDVIVPLKYGWLLKKRDVMGWRSRYFLIYPGRLEYYEAQVMVKLHCVRVCVRIIFFCYIIIIL